MVPELSEPPELPYLPFCNTFNGTPRRVMMHRHAENSSMNAASHGPIFQEVGFLLLYGKGSIVRGLMLPRYLDPVDARRLEFPAVRWEALPCWQCWAVAVPGALV